MSYVMHYLLFSIIYFSYFFPFWHKETKKKLFLHVTMLIYLCIVFTFTIIPLPTQLHYTYKPLIASINFIPFRDVFHGYLFAKREIILNIFLMVPYGFFIPLLTNKKVLYTIFSTCLFSLTIETTQLLTIMFETKNERIVDLTDLLTNTTGGALGYSFFYLMQKIIRKKP